MSEEHKTVKDNSSNKFAVTDFYKGHAALTAALTKLDEGDSAMAEMLALEAAKVLSKINADLPKPAADEVEMVILSTMSQYALQIAMGNRALSLELAEDILQKVSTKTLKPCEELAATLSNVACCLEPCDRIREAIPLLQKALAILDDPTVRQKRDFLKIVVHNLAQFLMLDSRHDEAGPLVERLREFDPSCPAVVIFDQHKKKRAADDAIREAKLKAAAAVSAKPGQYLN